MTDDNYELQAADGYILLPNGWKLPLEVVGELEITLDSDESLQEAMMARASATIEIDVRCGHTARAALSTVKLHANANG